MEPFQKLLLENKAWSEERIRCNPTYFQDLSLEQEPQFLWIGCSDSRVPGDYITNSQPGEMFVHRNIANLVVENDVNLLSVLQYAVHVLKVPDVIVCGHYGCGGVKAAMDGTPLHGPINQWIQNIRNLMSAQKDELEAINDVPARFQRLVELNVKHQVQKLAELDVLQQAWKKEARPDLHGWVYGLENGLIRELIHKRAPKQST